MVKIIINHKYSASVTFRNIGYQIHIHRGWITVYILQVNSANLKLMVTIG